MNMNSIGLCWCEVCAGARALAEEGVAMAVRLTPPKPAPGAATARPHVIRQVVPPAAPVPKPVAGPTMKTQLTGIIAAMTPQERASFNNGFAKAQAAGFLGTQEHYLVQQAAIATHPSVQPGDPRMTTQLSAATLGKYTTLRNANAMTPTAKVAAPAGGAPAPAAPGANVPTPHAAPVPSPAAYIGPKPVQLPRPTSPMARTTQALPGRPPAATPPTTGGGGGWDEMKHPREFGKFAPK